MRPTERSAGGSRTSWLCPRGGRSPGRFCSGWDFKNHVTFTLLVVNANNARLNINAPTSGNYAGIAFTSRRNATPTILQKFSKNAEVSLQGAIYFPNQLLEIDNNGATSPN